MYINIYKETFKEMKCFLLYNEKKMQLNKHAKMYRIEININFIL